MIRIGVTGHRLLADIPKLQAGIDQVLLAIEQINPRPDWMVISPLAEGADRLVVEMVLKYLPTARLVVPLPLPVDEYQKDFQETASLIEFKHWLNLAAEVVSLPTPVRRTDGYLAAGLYVLDHCDVLIALWDGQVQQGQGGTGQIVALARERRMRLAWVYSQRNSQDGIVEGVYSNQESGTIRFENF